MMDEHFLLKNETAELAGEACLNPLIYMEEQEDGCMEQRK